MKTQNKFLMKLIGSAFILGSVNQLSYADLSGTTAAISFEYPTLGPLLGLGSYGATTAAGYWQYPVIAVGSSLIYNISSMNLERKQKVFFETIEYAEAYMANKSDGEEVIMGENLELFTQAMVEADPEKFATQEKAALLLYLDISQYIIKLQAKKLDE